MKNRCAGFLVLLVMASTGARGDDAQKWWEHVRFLAADEMHGRETGSPEHRLAAEYVAGKLEALGLAPGGTSGFLQKVPFFVRTVQEESSSLAIVRDGK
ncbi:MAG TPA: peptidase M28, partial [Vicinamibacteria bacterium]